MIGNWFARCLDFLIPLTCASCEARVSAGALLCEQCAEQQHPFESVILDSVGDGYLLTAAYAYAAPVKQAIHRFKFNNRPDLAGRFATQIAAVLKRQPLPPGAVLVPVPLTAQRLVERSYNQAALLSGSLAGQLGLAHRPRALRRLHDAAHQVGANKATRAEQVAGVFAADPRKIGNSDVVLVDDVITTGATAKACAAALAEVGARVVAVAAIARVL